MIYALDEQQKIVMWNKQCERVFGWSKAELQQFQQPLKLFYPDKKYRDQVLHLPEIEWLFHKLSLQHNDD